MTETAEAPSKPATKAAWVKAKVHTATLPSGTTVKLTIPSLPQLIKAGKIPNHLIDVAVQQAEAEKITKELMEQTWEFTEFLVPEMVIEPNITKEDVPSLPALDLEMLIQFASRITDMDAVGHQLGGLETQKAFRDHRGIYDFTAGLEGV
jgi:hypothetical protein